MRTCTEFSYIRQIRDFLLRNAALEDSEGDPLMEDYNTLFPQDEDECEAQPEPIDTVIGSTPKNAEIV
ncbi:hypothetical protein OESDEN_05279 [Oesophagostomum dentatum]|uniref:Uncharacterized protein n=1 Tax=Oesophagostomum dentatum TaxID=61180 RepID=A0A0B1THA0_OESDE|nr:hypothetical protein OESDEN_05279 [Oesophagostomum dentatum]